MLSIWTTPKKLSIGKELRYKEPEDRFFFNRVISVISIALRGTTLTISDSTREPVSVEYEEWEWFPLVQRKYPR